jgi:hypothetical protein
MSDLNLVGGGQKKFVNHCLWAIDQVPNQYRKTTTNQPTGHKSLAQHQFITHKKQN